MNFECGSFQLWSTPAGGQSQQGRPIHEIPVILSALETIPEEPLLYLLYQTTCAIPPPFYLARCFVAFNPKPPTKNSENVKKLNQQENMEKYVDAPFKKVVFQPFQLFQPQIFTSLDSFLHWDPRPILRSYWQRVDGRWGSEVWRTVMKTCEDWVFWPMG